MTIIAPTPRIMIVEGRFYKELADEMSAGAIDAVEAANAEFECVPVPGAFEIPAAIKFAIKAMEIDPSHRRFDGYIALGCVIRGETTHYDYVCGESARGLMDLSKQYSLAIGYGILTCENSEQAWARASREGGNKGAVAANACLEMIRMKTSFGLFPR
ncbi:MAG: 6,7-dimethyl-8-ribityllumazine synthase 1 [Alphaproteobacteria bacterium MarineAlpha4_Bin2]|nr:MAG: 6,7-dimethyl-8-ribityllumazine synthase 1 [Alphaproteobacteria bacterium MarineAlpha4_Bin2]